MKREQSVAGISAEQRMTTNQIVTVADLENFKQEIIDTITERLDNLNVPKEKTWLKSYQVMKLLNISANKLQDIREKGILPFSKIGGVFYYCKEDIDRMLESHKHTSGSKN